MLVNSKYIKVKDKFLKYLEKNKVENRPIISGNFLNQPSVNLFGLNSRKTKLPGAQEIEDRGFFIGIHTKKINNNELNLLESKLLKISDFK